MAHHKTPDQDHKIKIPVKAQQNPRTENWQLIDSTDTIIADNLTKEIAEALEQACNICPTALEFTKFFVEWEDIIEHSLGTPTEADVEYWNTIYNEALEFMVELGLISPLPMWKDLLMENHYKVVNKWED